MAMPVRVVGKSTSSILGILLVAILVGIGGTLGVLGVKWAVNEWGGDIGLASTVLEGETSTGTAGQTLVVDTRAGVGATLNFDEYDDVANSETEVWTGQFWVFDETGSKIINGGTGVNSTTAVTKGGKVKVYIGGTGVLGKDYPVYSVNREVETMRLDVSTLAAETSLTALAYDSDNNVLGTHANTSSSYDYNITLGASGTELVYAKLTNEDDNSAIAVGTFCTLYAVNSTGLDKYEVVESGWEKSVTPKQMKQSAITLTRGDGSQGTNSDVNVNWDDCYIPTAGPIVLKEWEELRIKTRIVAATTNPASNTGSVFCGIFVDTNYRDGKDGSVKNNYYRYDDNERVTEVGISDTHTSPQGRTSGFCVDVN